MHVKLTWDRRALIRIRARLQPRRKDEAKLAALAAVNVARLPQGCSSDLQTLGIAGKTLEVLLLRINVSSIYYRHRWCNGDVSPESV